MFNREGIRTLHGVTHDRLDLLLDHVAKLPPADFVRELQGFGFASVRDQLAHLLGAEERWVHRLQSLPMPKWVNADYQTAESIRPAKARVKAATVAYLDRLPESELNATLAHRPPNWNGDLRSPAFILHHVITHAFHHKGQVVAMCRLLGHPAPDTDMQN
jgi:uncharacterized damage-inducible protein DinB